MVARRSARFVNCLLAMVPGGGAAGASVVLVKLIALKVEDSIKDVQRWVGSGATGSSPQGFPVLDASGNLVGVLTRRDILDGAAAKHERIRELVHRLSRFVYDDCTIRQAAGHMANTILVASLSSRD